MNYKELEALSRRAICKTLGNGVKGFDSLIVSCDPFDDAHLDGLCVGTTVELSFEPSISPLSYFSSDVNFYISYVGLSSEAISPATVAVFFGNRCSDVQAAEEAASDFYEEAYEMKLQLCAFRPEFR